MDPSSVVPSNAKLNRHGLQSAVDTWPTKAKSMAANPSKLLGTRGSSDSTIGVADSPHLSPEGLKTDEEITATIVEELSVMASIWVLVAASTYAPRS